MRDRLVQLALTLLCAYVLLAACASTILRYTSAAASGALRLLDNSLGALLVVLFTVGLGVRIVEGVRGGERTARERRERSRRLRVTMRAVAEDVPLHDRGERMHADPDPALTLEDA